MNISIVSYIFLTLSIVVFFYNVYWSDIKKLERTPLPLVGGVLMLICVATTLIRSDIHPLLVAVFSAIGLIFDYVFLAEAFDFIFRRGKYST